MDDWRASVFTPFARRFTDERAHNIRETRRLYDRVGERHRRFKADEKRRRVKERVWEIIDRYTPISEFYMPLFEELIDDFLDAEPAVFAFPEGLDLKKLSLKEQIDVTRFLYAKSHALDHEERILNLLVNGIERNLCAFAERLPEVSLLETPLFSLTLATTMDEPGMAITKIYSTLVDDKYVENGLFAKFGYQMLSNLAEVSGNDPFAPKRPWKYAHECSLPPEDMVRTYLGGTPLTKLFMLPVPLQLDPETRFSHMHLVGGSGAGKTQALQHLILHDLQSEDPPALVIIDSQGDLIGKLSRLGLFHPEDGRLSDRLLLITPRDIERPPALNIFDVQRERLGEYDAATREQVIAGVIQTFDYLFSGLIGADLTAKQDVFFKFVARLMLALPDTMGRPATILDFLSLMEDAAPYKEAIQSLPAIQRQFFERDFPSKTFAQTREQIRYRLNAILENPTLARLFTSPASRIDLFDALNDNKVILVDTAKDFLKGASGNFGRIFISLVFQAILERAAIPESERKPAYLIVDEAAEYFDSNIDDLLTAARKYKLGCIFAHQFLDQASHSLRASFAANTAIKMASGVSTADARALAPDMRTTPDFIQSQPRLHFATYIRGTTSSAVSVAIPPGRLESESRMSDDAYATMRENNRRKTSFQPEVLARMQQYTEETVRPEPREPDKEEPATPDKQDAGKKPKAKSTDGGGTDTSKDW